MASLLQQTTGNHNVIIVIEQIESLSWYHLHATTGGHGLIIERHPIPLTENL